MSKLPPTQGPQPPLLGLRTPLHPSISIIHGPLLPLLLIYLLLPIPVISSFSTPHYQLQSLGSLDSTLADVAALAKDIWRPVDDEGDDLAQETQRRRLMSNISAVSAYLGVPVPPTGCNLGEGSWFPDKNRTSYGRTCQYVRPIFRCQNRKDAAYLQYRWQPWHCDLAQFNAKAFLSLLRNKVIGFVGDSIQFQLFQSVLCLLEAGSHPLTRQGKKSANENAIPSPEPTLEELKVPWKVTPGVGADLVFPSLSGSPPSKSDLRLPTGAGKNYVQAFVVPEYNVTLAYVWSSFLVDAKQMTSRSPNGTVLLDGIHVTLDRLEPGWSSLLPKLDVLVIESGNWFVQQFGRQRKPNVFIYKGRTLSNITAIYRQALATVRDELSRKGRGVETYFVSFSASHRKMDRKAGAVCGSNRPLSLKEVQNWRQTQGILTYLRTAKEVFGVRNSSVAVVDVTSATLLRPDAHMDDPHLQPGSGDCTHWCQPGVPDTWPELIFGTMLQRKYPTGGRTGLTVSRRGGSGGGGGGGGGKGGGGGGGGSKGGKGGGSDGDGGIPVVGKPRPVIIPPGKRGGGSDKNSTDNASTHLRSGRPEGTALLLAILAVLVLNLLPLPLVTIPSTMTTVTRHSSLHNMSSSSSATSAPTTDRVNDVPSLGLQGVR